MGEKKDFMSLWEERVLRQGLWSRVIEKTMLGTTELKCLVGERGLSKNQKI